ncbi:thiol-disulfide oxidoreductase DCC family protein [Turneriella parva]|uniref:thiol-disulfide oxidoreductase DCC family protein n=1 Tax=Turneriella parva TaxID=29510 RepID=UPI00315DED7D
MIRHERNHVVKFAPLQGETFKKKHSAHTLALPDSIVFSVQGRLCLEAEAVIAISEYLKQPWRFFGSLGRLVPAFMANALYRFVARNRYRWFGKREACYLPTPELRARFLD